MDLHQHIRDVFRAAQFVTRDDLRSEPAVQNTKWFDYRFLPAVDATELFARAYTTSFRKKWRAYRDREEADRKRPLKLLFTDRSEFTSLWRARLVADSLGVPYEFFIDQAIDAAAGRNCRKFPRPNQLAHDFNLPRILAAWEQHRQTKVIFSSLPEYHSVNFRALPEQIAHQEWVVEQIKLVGASDYRIGAAVYVDCVLLEEKARRAFGEDLLLRARDAVSASTGVVVAAPAFRRSCFGLTSAFDEGECITCDSFKLCGKIASALDRKLVSKLGVNDGHKANERAKGRERQRLFRERRKAAAAAT